MSRAPARGKSPCAGSMNNQSSDTRQKPELRHEAKPRLQLNEWPELQLKAENPSYSSTNDQSSELRKKLELQLKEETRALIRRKVPTLAQRVTRALGGGKKTQASTRGNISSFGSTTQALPRGKILSAGSISSSDSTNDPSSGSRQKLWVLAWQWPELG